MFLHPDKLKSNNTLTEYSMNVIFKTKWAWFAWNIQVKICSPRKRDHLLIATSYDLGNFRQATFIFAHKQLHPNW